MNNLVLVSPSPHDYSTESVPKLMYGVLIAVIPAFVLSVFYFGIGALIVTLTSILSCVLFEWAITKFLLKKEPSVLDGSAILTGLLLAFNVPSNLPVWIIIIGALVAIGMGKMSYGGLGNNLFNPALVGRVFLLISFPVQMTSWPKPVKSRMAYLDTETGATPLAIMKEGIKNGESVASVLAKNNFPTDMDLFIGFQGGSLGEMAAAALLLGLVYMLIKKIITWHIPISIFGAVIIFTGILHLANPEQYADPIFHLLSGGLMMGAIFMATDYVTSPMSRSGMVFYGIMIGILTIVIRIFGAYPEGVSFAILIMNAFTPLINRYFKPKRFGKEVKNG